MNKKNILILLLAASLIFLLARAWLARDYSQIMAVTGATPLAVNRDVPSGMSLKVTGMVKKEYRFGAGALNAFARTRVRTREISTDGKYEGAYNYMGVPLYNILEGVAPKKPETAAFDRPLDMLVTVVSSTGNRSLFSYGELVMADDRHPVLLAYDRTQVLPSKDPELYTKNIHTENIKGLRLVCPRDSDTGRYLDNVVEIVLSEPEAPNAVLPKMKKGEKCGAPSLTCVSEGVTRPARLSGLEPCSVKNWVRIGHGRGYKGVSAASGYGLRSFLKANFSGCGSGDFFLFVACDGYRVLLSGREIFSTQEGESMFLANGIDGKRTSDFMLAPSADYFVDRDVWGLSHVVILKLR